MSSLCNMRLSALYNHVYVVASSVSSLCAIVYYITIAPYDSKILCLLKRASKGHQVQVCSSGLFVNQVYSLFVVLSFPMT